MRRLTYTKGWCILLFIISYSTNIFSQDSILVQMLTGFKNSNYTTTQYSLALFYVLPQKAFSMEGTQHFGIKRLNTFGASVNWPSSRLGFQSLQINLFEFGEWYRIQSCFGASHRITPNFSAGMSIQYHRSALKGRSAHQEANTSIYLALKMSKKLFLSTSLINLIPQNNSGRWTEFKGIVIHSFYEIHKSIIVLGGVKLSPIQTADFIAGLGLRSNKNRTVLIVYPTTGSYEAQYDREIKNVIHLRLAFQKHPLLGLSSTVGIHWRYN